MKVLSVVAMLLSSAQAVKISATPAAPAPKVNQYDGLVHGANGATSFPEGGAVGGVNVMDNTSTFHGPVPGIYTSENGSAMTHVDIVQSQGNGHIGGVWPYRQDTTGVQAAKVAGVREAWQPPAAPAPVAAVPAALAADAPAAALSQVESGDVSQQENNYDDSGDIIPEVEAEVENAVPVLAEQSDAEQEADTEENNYDDSDDVIPENDAPESTDSFSLAQADNEYEENYDDSGDIIPMSLAESEAAAQAYNTIWADGEEMQAGDCSCDAGICTKEGDTTGWTGTTCD